GRLPKRNYRVDGELAPWLFDLKLARTLESLLPWGQGCEAPGFAGEFEVASARVVGKSHLQLALLPLDDTGRAPLDAIAFNCALRPARGDRLHLVYSLGVNRFRNRESLQLRVQAIAHEALPLEAR
ncbi:MAG: single-stranded-DNA-specific exonuclease RecJ, partial [Gammaproteobacteria bacterium]